jgi:crotonobetainyl-CoA:carnitine CoA-transferase CaiB-like acyl-CoA transferase
MVCAALRERAVTGVGAHIDISLFDIMCGWMMPLLLAEQLSGESVPPAGMRHATIKSYGPDICSDGIVNIAVQNDGQWRRLCRHVLGDPELAEDPEFATNTLRLRRRVECEARVQSRIAEMDRATLEAALYAADVPWGRLNNSDVLAHPQLAETGRWTHALLPGGDRVSVLADPFRFAGRGTRPPQPVAALGRGQREAARFTETAHAAVDRRSTRHSANGNEGRR